MQSEASASTLYGISSSTEERQLLDRTDVRVHKLGRVFLKETPMTPREKRRAKIEDMEPELSLGE